MTVIVEVGGIGGTSLAHVTVISLGTLDITGGTVSITVNVITIVSLLPQSSILIHLTE